MKKKDPNQNQVRQEEKEDRKNTPSKTSKEAKNDEIDKHMEENGEHSNEFKNKHPLGSLMYSKDEILNLLNDIYPEHPVGNSDGYEIQNLAKNSQNRRKERLEKAMEEQQKKHQRIIISKNVQLIHPKHNNPIHKKKAKIIR